jgi:hypothetical protein
MHIQSIEHCLTMRIVFTPPHSHNRIELEEHLGKGDYMDWWSSWVPASVSIVKISHNLLRQVNAPDPAAVLLASASIKWPELQGVDLSHNFLHGHIATDSPGIHYNFDVSNNNISGIQVGSAGKLSAFAYMREMHTVDWRNQQTPVQFYDDKQTGFFSHIDDALNSAGDVPFAVTTDYLPRLDSFEQVKYPKGSDETPFACPLW